MKFDSVICHKESPYLCKKRQTVRKIYGYGAIMFGQKCVKNQRMVPSISR